MKNLNNRERDILRHETLIMLRKMASAKTFSKSTMIIELRKTGLIDSIDGQLISRQLNSCGLVAWHNARSIWLSGMPTYNDVDLVLSPLWVKFNDKKDTISQIETVEVAGLAKKYKAAIDDLSVNHNTPEAAVLLRPFANKHNSSTLLFTYLRHSGHIINNGKSRYYWVGGNVDTGTIAAEAVKYVRHNNSPYRGKSIRATHREKEVERKINTELYCPTNNVTHISTQNITGTSEDRRVFIKKMVSFNVFGVKISWNKWVNSDLC